MDIVDNGIALGNSAVCEAPAVVDVAGVAGPGVLVHCHGDAGVKPVRTAGRDYNLVGGVLLEAPVTFTVNIAVLTCQLGISVGNEGGELLGCLEVIFLADVGEHLRRKVCAGNSGKTHDSH